jgi:hypothetical protein
VNCPAPRWTQLRADGSADFLFNPARVFDTVLGAWRAYGISGCVDQADMEDADYLSIPGDGGTGGGCGGRSVGNGSSLGFVIDPIVSPYIGSTFYTNSNHPSPDPVFNLARVNFLPSGNYPFRIDNNFTGVYHCNLGGTVTVYHGECDPLNVAYSASSCSTPVRVSTPFTETQRKPVGFSVSTFGQACASGVAGGTRYYDGGCSVVAPASRTTPIVCTINGAATTINNPPKINENVPNIPPNLVDFRNRLTVNSTLNGSSVTGVAITQVGGAPLGLGGATNYTVSPEQSINAILQAPASFSGGNFSSWTGCNVDASLVDPKQCRVIMNESPTGGSSRTIVANYTAVSPPSTPILSAVHSSTCGSGQIDLSWNNVANETGYVLEYSTNSSSGPWSNLVTLGADVTSYPHTGLSAGTLYYYRIRATSSAGNSGNGAAQENAPYNCLTLTCTRNASKTS